MKQTVVVMMVVVVVVVVVMMVVVVGRINGEKKRCLNETKIGDWKTMGKKKYVQNDDVINGIDKIT